MNLLHYKQPLVLHSWECTTNDSNFISRGYRYVNSDGELIDVSKEVEIPNNMIDKKIKSVPSVMNIKKPSFFTSNIEVILTRAARMYDLIALDNNRNSFNPKSKDIVVNVPQLALLLNWLLSVYRPYGNILEKEDITRFVDDFISYVKLTHVIQSLTKLEFCTWLETNISNITINLNDQMSAVVSTVYSEDLLHSDEFIAHFRNSSGFANLSDESLSQNRYNKDSNMATLRIDSNNTNKNNKSKGKKISMNGRNVWVDTMSTIHDMDLSCSEEDSVIFRPSTLTSIDEKELSKRNTFKSINEIYDSCSDSEDDSENNETISQSEIMSQTTSSTNGSHIHNNPIIKNTLFVFQRSNTKDVGSHSSNPIESEHTSIELNLPIDNLSPNENGNPKQGSSPVNTSNSPKQSTSPVNASNSPKQSTSPVNTSNSPKQSTSPVNSIKSGIKKITSVIKNSINSTGSSATGRSDETSTDDPVDAVDITDLPAGERASEYWWNPHFNPRDSNLSEMDRYTENIGSAEIVEFTPKTSSNSNESNFDSRLSTRARHAAVGKSKYASYSNSNMKAVKEVPVVSGGTINDVLMPSSITQSRKISPRAAHARMKQILSDNDYDSSDSLSSNLSSKSAPSAKGLLNDLYSMDDNVSVAESYQTIHSDGISNITQSSFGMSAYNKRNTMADNDVSPVSTLRVALSPKSTYRASTSTQSTFRPSNTLTFTDDSKHITTRDTLYQNSIVNSIVKDDVTAASTVIDMTGRDRSDSLDGLDVIEDINITNETTQITDDNTQYIDIRNDDDEDSEYEESNNDNDEELSRSSSFSFSMSSRYPSSSYSEGKTEVSASKIVDILSLTNSNEMKQDSKKNENQKGKSIIRTKSELHVL
jgi:hypothetical protein